MMRGGGGGGDIGIGRSMRMRMRMRGIGGGDIGGEGGMRVRRSMGMRGRGGGSTIIIGGTGRGMAGRESLSSSHVPFHSRPSSVLSSFFHPLFPFFSAFHSCPGVFLS